MFGFEAPCGEQKNMCRRVVEPVRVIYDADDRLLLTTVREQAQNRKADKKTIWWRVVGHSESSVQCRALWMRKSGHAVEYRREELMERRKWELHLELGAGSEYGAERRGVPHRLRDQGRLPDASLASYDECSSMAIDGALDEAQNPTKRQLTA
jgi:hypothetical protein